MPITTPGTYPPVMQAFIDHWNAVNTAINPTVLTLQGGYTVANFTTDRGAIQTALNNVITKDNARQGGKASLDTARANLRIRLGQFRGMVRALFPGSRYESMLPNLPPVAAAESKFLNPFTDAANIWNQINTDTIPGFTGPLLLAGGYTLATFNTDLTAVRNSYISYTQNLLDSSGARADRDVLLGPGFQRMKQYRLAAPGILPAGSPLLATIPALSPNLGPAAKPVNPTIHWDAGLVKAVITYAASASTDVAEYALRTAPGPTYRSKEENTIDSGGPTVLTFQTDIGLSAPGATAIYKVYTITATGREAGSIVLRITRPV